MAAAKKQTEDTELNTLLAELKEKTGIEFMVKEQNPAGREETIKQIRLLLSSGRAFGDKNDFMRKIISGETAPAAVYDGLKKLHMDPSESYLLYVVELKQESEVDAEYILRTLFRSPSSSFVLRMDGCRLVLIRAAGKLPAKDSLEADMEETAHTISDTLSGEAMTNASVSFCTQPRKAEALADSYREASLALRIGDIFYARDRIFSYGKLGIARLIYELPVDVCIKYLHEIFGDKEPETPDEETANIISAFFENGLNISETARQLYLHRNTLVYRLEKISRATGLDIRNFDDAITYRIATMIREYVKYKSL